MTYQNKIAFLDMIAWSEGTSMIPNSDNGYRVLVGGGLFRGYEDHPRKLVFLPNVFNYKTGKRGLFSSAAGRYQIISKMYDAYKKILGLKDFSPIAQDAIAIRMISERGALSYIERGDIRTAIGLASGVWASLPGAGYGQHEQKITGLIEKYIEFGGSLS